MTASPPYARVSLHGLNSYHRMKLLVLEESLQVGCENSNLTVVVTLRAGSEAGGGGC